MKSRLFLSAVALVLAGPASLALATATALPASATECSARTYNVYDPTTGDRLVAADAFVYTPTGEVVANPQACLSGSATYIGTASGVNVTNQSLGSVAQACYLPVVNACLFNYGASVDVNGTLSSPAGLVHVGNDANPANPPLICVSTCPTAKVDTGLDVTVQTLQYSDAIIDNPQGNNTYQLCVSYREVC
jgi:hypothetical protein